MHLTYVAITTLGLAILTAQSAAASPDAGKAKPELAAVERYLADHDVASAAELRSLGSVPDRSLMTIASNEHAEALTRARAVAALRLFPSPIVQSYLEDLVKTKATATTATDRLIVRRAAIALGWMAGSDGPDLLAALFANEDAEVRVDAVIAISISRAATAADTLRRQLVVESSPRVRQQIERQLVALAPKQPEPEKAPSSPKKPARPPMRSGF